MARPERRKYALANFIVELRDRGWYYGQQFDPPSNYRGPYVSVASVSLMVAREVRKEVERRHRAVTRLLTNNQANPPF
jgi:hypothetical protein